jgi:hypothetical protein
VKETCAAISEQLQLTICWFSTIEILHCDRNILTEDSLFKYNKREKGVSDLVP